MTLDVNSLFNVMQVVPQPTTPEQELLLKPQPTTPKHKLLLN